MVEVYAFILKFQKTLNISSVSNLNYGHKNKGEDNS